MSASALTCSLAKTGHWQPRSATYAVHSVGISSFHPFAIVRQVHPIIIQLFRIENHVFAIDEVLRILHMVLPAQCSE
jgi:hypothetical protein